MTDEQFKQLVSLHSLEFVLRYFPRSVYALDQCERIDILTEEQRNQLVAKITNLRNRKKHK